SSQPSLLSVHSPTTHLILFLFFLLLIPPPPSSTLFPYTTLFRSRLAPGDARQVLALLGVGAEAHEPGRRHVGVDEDAEGHAARAAARHLLAEHDAGEEVGPTPTVLRRELEAEETELAEALPQLAWDASRRLPLADARRDLLLDEGVDRPSEHLVLVAEQRMRHQIGRASCRERGEARV